jgi:nitrate/nitrite transporter NarK
LLARYVPQHLRAFLFSVKQTSVPVGGALAGFVLPIIATSVDWRVAAASGAVLCIGLAAFAEGRRRDLDDDRDPSASIGVGSATGAIRLVARTPALRRLAVASAAFAGLQFTFTSFFVSYVADRAGFSLVAAGSALSVAMTTSIGARLLWGWIADRWGGPIVIALLGMAMAVFFGAIYLVGPTWPYGAVVALGVAVGATALSWNGVYLSEVAREAPPGRVTDATAGCMFITFIGGLAEPALFSALVALTGGYLEGFVAIAMLALACGFLFLARGKPRRQHHP